MKRTLAALSHNLGPEPLKALTGVIQTAFATTPPADEAAFSQLMELMSDFGMSQQCQDQVAEAISAPIDFETIQSDPEVTAASILFQEQHVATTAIPTHWTQWQTWVVETLWTGWEFMLHIHPNGDLRIGRPYAPATPSNRPHLSVDLRSLLQDSLMWNPCPIAPIPMTEKEGLALGTIRSDNVNQVRILLDPQGTPRNLEVGRNLNATRGHRLEELLTRHGYEDLTLKTQNGHVVFASHTTKHRL